jgi:hypothetical protein
MKRSSKQYQTVPAGKKVIYRWSFIHPKTGAKIVARNRPFRMVVDDVPAQRANSRPVSVQWLAPHPMVATKPARRRSKKAARQARPVSALVPQTLRLVPPVRMSPVEVVPPAASPKPHPGSHGDAHDVLGAIAGGMRAAHQAPANLSSAAAFFEALGGAVAGSGATRVSAAIGQSKPQEHAKAVEELVQSVGNLSPECTQELRALAEQFRQKREAEAGPTGSAFAEAGYGLLEMLMHLFAGAVNGAPAGARTHLALVDPTEENVKRLASGI